MNRRIFASLGSAATIAAFAAFGGLGACSNGASDIDDGEGAGHACPDLESTFEKDVLAGVLAPKCSSCHNPEGAAKATRLHVTDDVKATFVIASELVREQRGEGSLLLSKVLGGDGHGGGAVLTRDSHEFQSLSDFSDRLEGKCSGTAKAQPAHVNQRFVRRLSTDEYENTVRDLVGIEGMGRSLPPESHEEVFDNGAGTMRTDTDYFQQILDNAKAIAESPELRWSELASCSTQDRACAESFIASFGLRAFRRPTTADDVLRYTAVYEGIGAGNHEKGIRAIVRGMLASPFFLFRTELGVKNGEKNQLTGYEIAAELSYLFWATMPDQALFDAARDGKLATKAEIAAQAARLLADPRAAAAQERFVRQWLDLRLLSDKTKDPMRFPAFTRDVQGLLADETTAFFLETVKASDDGSLRALLTADSSYLSEGAAAFYGVPWEGPAVGSRKRVTLPGRSGILTHAGILALGATSTEPVAILRGKLVRTRLLCQSIGHPPADAAAVTAALPPPKDNRERAQQLLGNPNCAGCHRRMDPLGLGYEGFDATGMPSGVTDVTGEVLDAPSTDGPFDGPAELHAKLAASADVQACFTKLWTRYAYGVADSEEGTALVEALARDFAGQGTNIAALMLSLTQTDHFVMRNADPDEEAPPPAKAPAPPSATPGNPSGSDAGSSGGGMVPDVPTTPGVTYMAQPGYEDGGKEEGAGNWWIRGMITNTTTTPITNWAYRMPRPGDFVESSKVTAGVAGAFWILRSGAAENQTLMPNQSYYIELRFSK